MPLFKDAPIPVFHGDLSAPSDLQLVERLLKLARKALSPVDIHNA
jgi:hypothetical protein